MSEHDAESDAPRVCHVCADPSKATWQIRGLLWCIDDAVAHGVARVENDARPWRWVACSITEFGHVGEKRHLARKGALTTFCGHSATYPDIWRRDSRKPKCAACEAAETRVIPSERTGDE